MIITPLANFPRISIRLIFPALSTCTNILDTEYLYHFSPAVKQLFSERLLLATLQWFQFFVLITVSKLFQLPLLPLPFVIDRYPSKMRISVQVHHRFPSILGSTALLDYPLCRANSGHAITIQQYISDPLIIPVPLL